MPTKAAFIGHYFRLLPQKTYIFKDLEKKVPFWLFFYVQAAAFSI
jgi:hypothetical protein